MRVHTFACLFRDDATTSKGPRCDEGTNLRLRDFAVVPLMPTRELEADRETKDKHFQQSLLLNHQTNFLH